MAISDRTRRFLWGRSGNRCAICKTELIPGGQGQGGFNRGEECHIISAQPTGPRYKSGLPDYDAYDNLIPLCRNDHKMIDELTDTYTEELLRYIKTAHENWVSSTMDCAIGEKKEAMEKPRFLTHITSGKELVGIIAQAHAYATDYDESGDAQEMDYIGSTLGILLEYGDNMELLDIQDRIQLALRLGQTLKELDERGYMVFADRSLQPMHQDDSSYKWEVATILIKRKDNPEIITVDLSKDQQQQTGQG